MTTSECRIFLNLRNLQNSLCSSGPPRHLKVAAIETRSLPSSLAAARRGFTFYLADPSARLPSIA
jgi:hypothetical protein